jgi:NAD(P)-dependent dehydrogenase (short-subunit alcohol dehydrogenase family)
MKMKDKVVLVTGGSKGIGKAIAIGLAQEGASIAVNYASDKAGAAATVNEISKFGRKAVTVQADISRVADIKRMFKKVVAEFSRVDVLVNNAGITGWTTLFEITEEKWDEVIDTNLKGTFFCSLEAARLMREHGGGSIVNISSNCAELGVKHLVAYATSKGGIHALTKQLAVELAPFKIRVNTFAPGPTKVQRNLRDDPDYDRNWGRMVPLQRTAEPEEMIGPALFLASAASSYMTGQIFFVDGGWTAQGKIPEENMERAARRNA